MLFNCRNSSKNVLQHDLHVSSSGLAANIMFQSDLQDVQHSTAALYEVQRTEEQAQQTTRQPPSQQQRSDNTLMVVAEEEAGEAGETPKYGALIAQHLRTMTAVTGQYMTLLYSIQQTAFSSHQLHAAAASSSAPSSALAASGGAGSMGSSSAERSAAASKSVKDSGRLKKRVELLEGLLFLREYSEETSLDCANMDIATLQAKAVLR